jgi:nucleotide-binding universal stress UspA family protein
MAIKSILVHLSDDPRSAVRRGVAVDLARTHEAHLTALYIIPGSQIPSYIQVDIPDEVLVEQRRRVHEVAEAAKTEFLDLGEREGISVEWRTLEGVAIEQAELHARYFDLIVVGQWDREHPTAGIHDIAEDLVMTAGRPVLTIPYAGEFPHVGERILVAWDGTREASRAVHDALPFLVGAKNVFVYRINPPECSARARSAPATCCSRRPPTSAPT